MNFYTENDDNLIHNNHLITEWRGGSKNLYSLNQQVKGIRSLEPMEIQAAKALKEIGVHQLVRCKVQGDEDRWICPWKNCDELSPNLSGLRNHYLTMHNSRPFVCDAENCIWSFQTKSKLERHKRAHVTEKNFVCDFTGCGKTFKSKSNLRHHNKLIHELAGTFVCPIGDCEAAFHNQKNLDVHISEHEGATPAYSCKVENCGKSFFTRNALCTHMRRHLYKDGDLQCKLCGKEFEAPCRLRTHMQMHENERPYRCTEPGCQWSFPSQSKFQRHMDKHLQRRRFACSFPGCFKAFLRAEHLSDHMKTHVKVKVYRCPVEFCDAIFDARKLVLRHVAQAHTKSAASQPIPRNCGSAVTPIKATSSPNGFSGSDSSCSSPESRQSQKPPYFGSARTSLTYRDVVHEKKTRCKDSNCNESKMQSMLSSRLPEPTDLRDESELKPTSGAIELNLRDILPPDNCVADLDSRDILQPDSSSAVQQDPMLSAANLSDPSCLIMQDELLTQEYFLLLESTNRLSDFEPSTINLRDLE